MPQLTIRIINSKFATTDQGDTYASVDAAYGSAIQAGLAVASEEIRAGNKVGMVDISVEDVEGQVVAKGVVSVATSTLFVSQERSATEAAGRDDER